MAAMPDDGHRAPVAASSSSAKVGSAASSGVNLNTNTGGGAAPPGHHVLRRAKTTDDTAPIRSRSIPRRFSSDSSSEATGPPPPPQPRRSSNFSEYSLSEARDILNPRPHAHGAELSHQESPLASLSLAFALLPAIAGALFKNGSSVVTDVMLLGLAAVFLHWSVTQPWQWYHAAQEVRIREESIADAAVEEDSDVESLGHAPSSSAQLDDVPEEEDEEEEEHTEKKAPRNGPRENSVTARQLAALKELYRHEVLALFSCFVLPLLSAYLLHAIRSQLSRPSEGLVSNYNLTIFLLISELRTFSHVIKLVQSRTLHLQRVVHERPLGQSSTLAGLRLDDITGRLERLETIGETRDQLFSDQGVTLDSTKATVTREVRSTIQPELDALNRAVRRYEKKATLLQLQTESRFADVHARLDDAIALAAVAAKNTTATRRKSLLAWTAESMTFILLFPFKALLEIIALPLKPIVALANRNKQQPPVNARPSRTKSGNKSSLPQRYSGDRVPARLTKR